MLTKSLLQPNGAKKSFLFSLVLALAVFVPLIIYGHGCFLYMGDYNVQQIAFYKLAHEAVRSGNIFWNWTTDLGANFIGSYSFYLLFSPFFWLTLPFPTAAVPYLMGPLLVLKTACAALAGYFYIKRFVRDTDWAAVGAVLYAFSGFMLFNVFFNHFHEACVFFPLMLIALEELVENDRRGWFALSVALNAMVNYWFFIGEVVFVVLYVIIRITTGGWGCSVKKFFAIAFESVVGVLIACFAFLPSVMAIMGNPRTGTSELLTGELMWIWGWDQRLPAIIQSFFFPPEIPSDPVFFPEMGAKWASLSAWLPLFSCTGVIAFCRKEKKNFMKRMTVLSLIMAVVPIFNSAFVLFSNSYYARWFYMPVLLMCAMTASSLERAGDPEVAEGWKSGIRWCGGFVAVFVLAVGFSPVVNGEEVTFGLYSNELRFWFISLSALLCLVLTGILILLLRDTKGFKRITCAMLSVVIAGYSIAYIGSGKHSRDYDRWYLDTVVNGADEVPLPDNEFARSDFYECVDNLGMQWGLPNIQCFHSIVPVSVMTFYPQIGVKRDVSSKPETTYRELRDLLSVRWLFIGEDESEQQPMENFSFYDIQNGYNIYENDNWLPMGFAYTHAISAETAKEELTGRELSRYMMHAVMLNDGALERNRDILVIEDEPSAKAKRASSYDGILEERRSMTVNSFDVDNRGFTATSSFSKDRLVFFSVPYDAGWSAQINGESVKIERASYGFMAVRVPAGESVIRFNYWTPGLTEGIAATAVGIILLCVYLCSCTVIKSRKAAPMPETEEKSVPLSEYLESIESLPPEEEEEVKEEENG